MHTSNFTNSRCVCAVVEFEMIDPHSQLNGTVNVCIMDHRGTGRSESSTARQRRLPPAVRRVEVKLIPLKLLRVLKHWN